MFFLADCSLLNLIRAPLLLPREAVRFAGVAELCGVQRGEAEHPTALQRAWWRAMPRQRR
jgi:hypothetical protein